MKRGICTFTEKARGLQGGGAGKVVCIVICHYYRCLHQYAHLFARYNHPTLCPSDIGIVVNNEDSLTDMPAGKEETQNYHPLGILTESDGSQSLHRFSSFLSNPVHTIGQHFILFYCGVFSIAAVMHYQNVRGPGNIWSPSNRNCFPTLSLSLSLSLSLCYDILHSRLSAASGSD